MVEYLNYHIQPDSMDRMLEKLDIAGVDIDAFGEHGLREILHGRMAVPRAVGEVLYDHLLTLPPSKKEAFLYLCQQAYEEAIANHCPVIALRPGAPETMPSYEEYLKSLIENRNREVASLIGDHYSNGHRFGHFIADLLKLENFSAEELASDIAQRAAETEGYRGKSTISGGYLRSMATRPETSRPRSTVIDMLSAVYRLPEAETLMLYKVSRGEDIDIEQLLEKAYQAGDKRILIDALIRYSGLSEPAITRLTGIPHPTISGWRIHGMAVDSQEVAKQFLRITYHPDLIRDTNQKSRYHASYEPMLSMLTNRPIGRTLEQLAEEARQDGNPSSKMMSLLLGKHGHLNLSENQQMELLQVSRDMLYKMKAGHTPLHEIHAKRILDHIGCKDAGSRETVTALLTGIDSPQALFAQVRSSRLGLTDMIRKVMDRKDVSITDTEKAIGYTRLGPFLQNGNLKKHLYARRLAAFCDLAGDDAREFTVRAIHGNLPTYDPHDIEGYVKNGMDHKEARRILVQLSGMDGHELAGRIGVPHWIVTDWIASGRSHQLQPVCGELAKALGISTHETDEVCQQQGAAILDMLGRQERARPSFRGHLTAQNTPPRTPSR